MRSFFLACAALVALSAPGVHAQGDGGLGIGVGLIRVEDVTPPWLTLNLRYKPNRHLALEPDVGWYRRYFRDFYGVLSRTDAFDFGGSVLVAFPSRRWEVLVGGGVNAHVFKSTLDTSSLTGTHLGAHALAAFEIKGTDGLNLFAAIRHDAVGLGVGQRPLHDWKLFGGLRFSAN
jgi:hypothetical protein